VLQANASNFTIALVKLTVVELALAKGQNLKFHLLVEVYITLKLFMKLLHFFRMLKLH
jgi:hypothetical protein